VFNLIEVPGWVPTVELTVHLRARPAPGSLSCSFEARAVQGGMFEEDGVIFDENGVLVAQSRQIGLVPL
jgi:acyl-CoA thioesterase